MALEVYKAVPTWGPEVKHLRQACRRVQDLAAELHKAEEALGAADISPVQEQQALAGLAEAMLAEVAVDQPAVAVETSAATVAVQKVSSVAGAQIATKGVQVRRPGMRQPGVRFSFRVQ